jgi:alginate O-acetyltransferase complex protein AlgI
MLFNSLTFLVFFVCVVGIQHAPLSVRLSWTIKKANLVLASYLFYAAWNLPFVVLLWISTVVDWWVSQRIAKTEQKAARRTLLCLSLGVNLGIWGYFKYGAFAFENTLAFLGILGWQMNASTPSIILPVGISFYTFQTLSYTLDVYRGNLRPASSPLDFALYVSFFPQLVAGPIVRATHFLPQCASLHRTTSEQLGWGLSLLTLGLFEKMILADALLAPVADTVYGAWEQVGSYDAWIGTLAFSGQIFFDFAGYSTCAIGVALCLGFVLPDNFRFPYASVGFSEFWQRWHISLSSWLRDYLYIPLGGNRHGTTRTHINLMLTMLLGGLWHGASWHFVAWGGLHGLYLIGERLLKQIPGLPIFDTRLARPFLALLTYTLVCIAWVFFRAPDVTSAFHLLGVMLTGEEQASILGGEAWTVLGISVAVLIGQWWLREKSLKQIMERLPWWLRAVLLAMLLITLALTPGDDRAFLYFQF